MDAFQDRYAEKVRARVRRNQLDQAKAKAYRNARVFYPCPGGRNSWEEVEEARSFYVLYHYRNRKPCSCYMCGNYRRNLKTKDALTRQELRADLQFDEMCKEVR